MSSSVEAANWSLEVVRGREQGRRYVLPAGTTLLGSGPVEPGALDLSAQEPDPSRRMAPRQATIANAAAGLELRDLKSPGGTFVNRQRVASGASRRLSEGDVIQLGGVQLKVVGSASARPQTQPQPPSSSRPAQPATAGPSNRDFPYVSAGGTQCRNWDDFLRYSAQRWPELRDELTSGRLAAFLHAMGRSDLAPDPMASQDPDERLDQWLGRIPTSQPAAPALEVHPQRLVVEASAAGGTVRKVLRVSNTGHRILRVRVRVAEGTIVSLPPGVGGRELPVIDDREIPVIVQMPESSAPARGVVEIDSNAGTQRVEVEIQRPAEVGLAAAAASAGSADYGSMRQWLAGLPFWALPLTLGGGRLALSVLHHWFGDGAASHPDVILASAVMTKVGAVSGACYKVRQRLSAWDRVASVLCGGLCGMIAGTVWVACCRAIEPFIGPVPPPLLWAVIGVAAALWVRKGQPHVAS